MLRRLNFEPGGLKIDQKGPFGSFLILDAARLGALSLGAPRDKMYFTHKMGKIH